MHNGGNYVQMKAAIGVGRDEKRGKAKVGKRVEG